MKVRSLDHLVLTVASIEASCAFYTRVLGMEIEIFAEGRHALRFGDQKINLHEVGREFEPKADRPTPGSGDLCFLTDTPVEQFVSHLVSLDIEIIQGPVPRTGATGPLVSVYFRDPDGNLVEVANADG